MVQQVVWNLRQFEKWRKRPSKRDYLLGGLFSPVNYQCFSIYGLFQVTYVIAFYKAAGFVEFSEVA